MDLGRNDEYLERRGLRFPYLNRLAHHIVDGPDFLVPRDNPDDEYLLKLMSLKEHAYPSQVRKGWQVWMPSTDLRPNLLLPILRRVVYRRAATLELVKHSQVVEWPDVSVDYFQLCQDDLGVLDDLVRRLQISGIAMLEPEAGGLYLEYWYGPSATDLPGPFKTVSHQRGIFMHDLDVPELMCLVTDDETEGAEFNEAWLRVRGYLESVCTEERIPRALEEHWRVSPRRFADRLHDEQERGGEEPILITGNPYGPDTIRDFAG
jgi:hypothetical protein